MGINKPGEFFKQRTPKKISHVPVVDLVEKSFHSFRAPTYLSLYANSSYFCPSSLSAQCEKKFVLGVRLNFLQETIETIERNNRNKIKHMFWCVLF